MEHDDLWTEFLSRPTTVLWAERCTGMIGTWATTLRQRGDYRKCKEVMYGWYKKVLDIYMRGVEAEYAQYGSTIATENARVCARELKFKYLVILMNLGFNLEEFFPDDLAERLRFLISFELDTGMVQADTDNYAFMLAQIRKPVSQKPMQT